MAVGVPLKVVGLLGDRYLINNPIVIDFLSTEQPLYFKIKIVNLTNQKASTDIIIYPNANSYSTVDLSPLFKSLFDYPADADGYIIQDQIVNNLNRFKISIYYNETLDVDDELLGFETIKSFIRGGNRTTESNQTIGGLAILNISEKIPVWIGYDTAEYYLDGNNLMRKRLLMDIPSSRIDYRRPKGCNEVYVKFLNQRGGYSTWLFESHNNTESNDNLGGFVRNNTADDLGNEASNKITCNGKIPKAYKQLIDDLIVSPEIYAIYNGVTERVRSGRNSFTYDNIKRTYNVNIAFDIDYRFNPSITWSN